MKEYFKIKTDKGYAERTLRGGLFSLNKLVGETELLVSLAQEGKEIKKSKERLPVHMEAYEKLMGANKKLKRFNPQEKYVADFLDESSSLLKEYRVNIEKLRELI